MYRSIAWFQKNYPQLHREMITCNHNFDTHNLNPYHLESDCWSHTMMVCKMAEFKQYDKVVQIAALLHDIGKPSARKVNPKNNHVRFFGHEKLSAQMAEEILWSMRQEGMIDQGEKEEIIKLIENHSFLHKNPEMENLLEEFGEQIAFCIHLVQLSQCDNLGRFCADTADDAKYHKMLESLHSRQQVEIGRILTKEHCYERILEVYGSRL